MFSLFLYIENNIYTLADTTSYNLMTADYLKSNLSPDQLKALENQTENPTDKMYDTNELSSNNNINNIKSGADYTNTGQSDATSILGSVKNNVMSKVGSTMDDVKTLGNMAKDSVKNAGKDITNALGDAVDNIKDTALEGVNELASEAMFVPTIITLSIKQITTEVPRLVTDAAKAMIKMPNMSEITKAYNKKLAESKARISKELGEDAKNSLVPSEVKAELDIAKNLATIMGSFTSVINEYVGAVKEKISVYVDGDPEHDPYYKKGLKFGKEAKISEKWSFRAQIEYVVNYCSKNGIEFLVEKIGQYQKLVLDTISNWLDIAIKYVDDKKKAWVDARAKEILEKDISDKKMIQIDKLLNIAKNTKKAIAKVTAKATVATNKAKTALQAKLGM